MGNKPMYALVCLDWNGQEVYSSFLTTKTKQYMLLRDSPR